MALGLLTSSLRTLKSLKNVEIPLDRIQAPFEKVADFIKSQKSPDADESDYNHVTERKTRCQLFRLSAAVCGIEFCYAAETAFVSPTLLKIGVPVMYMTLIWCLSPLLGFFLVPLLGSISDRCRLNLGRRRPFIVALSCGIIIGLLLVSNGKDLGKFLGDKYIVQPSDSQINVLMEEINSSISVDRLKNITYNMTTSGDQDNIEPTVAHRWGILFTVIGVVMLDFSCDACQSPCRAYMLDVCVPADHSVGLSSFTVLAGLGGAFGYLLGGIDWENTALGISLGGHVRVVFTLVLIIYVVCLIITLTSIKEVPLKKLKGIQESLQKNKKKKQGKKYKKFTNEEDDDDDDVFHEEKTKYETLTGTNIEANSYNVGPGETNYPEKSQMNGYQTNINQVEPLPPKTIDSQPSIIITEEPHEKINIDPQEKINIDLLESEVTLKMYLMSIVRMPRSLMWLCLTNLFSWMSLLCYSLYFTDFVGQAVYKGDPSAPHGNPHKNQYNAGVRMGSFGMAMYSLACSAYSFAIEKLVAKFGARPIYVVSQLVYTVGSIVMVLWQHPVAVILLSPTSGIMYATLFTMPYILLANYHSNNQFSRLTDSSPGQIRGLGTDIALVSSMVFVAQFLLSSCMGSIVHAAGTTAAVIVAAAVLSFCGAMSATQVFYLDQYDNK